MKLFIRIVVTAILVMVLSYFMKGVRVDGVVTALTVAIVLGLLNAFIKPVLVFFTLPFTIFTLGLFLIVINGILILACTKIVGGFHVDSFWTATLFSIILSLSQSIMYKITGGSKK
jgi:putative membrane protein